jgi:hypothetical protein
MATARKPASRKTTAKAGPSSPDAAPAAVPPKAPKPPKAAKAGTPSPAKTTPRSAVKNAKDVTAKDKAATPPKAKLVRDSFTMPGADFALIAQLKERGLGLRRHIKKSELLRAGLHALAGLDDAALTAALDSLAPLKPGRPKGAAPDSTPAE